jgi:DNA-binding NarL/FixJ family response regulator
MHDRNPTASAVLLASESPERRRSWRRYLRGMGRVGEAAARAGLERVLDAFQPDVLLLDQQILGSRGIAQLPALLRHSPATHIIVCAAEAAAREQVAALKMGARGCCSLNAPGPLVRKAVVSVAQGEIWVARNVIPDLLKEVLALAEMQAKTAVPDDERFARLTRSERLIAHLIAGGASNKEIAIELTVTEKTVKAHLTAIFRKLGVSDRLRLAILMTQHRRLGVDPLTTRSAARSAVG